MRILHKWQYVFGSYNAILNMSGIAFTMLVYHRQYV